MSKLYTPKYKINYTDNHYMCFQWLLLVFQIIASKKSLTPLKNIILRKMEAKCFISIWAKLENEKHPELSPLPGTDTIITFTEDEVIAYTKLLILIPDAFNSIYYIMLKEHVPVIPIHTRIVDGIPETDTSAFENFEENCAYFNKECLVWFRFIRFHLRNNKRVISKLREVENVFN